MSKRFFILLMLLLFISLILGEICHGVDNYFLRCLLWGNSDVEDYKKFPSYQLEKGNPVFYFNKEIREDLVSKLNVIGYTYNAKMRKIEDLNRFLESTGTTAFIIIKDDVIIYEGYFNGYTRESINTSFSVAKSFVSILVGTAIDEGYIKSVDEPITNYIPELLKNDQDFSEVTVKHLLTMSSGIKYREGKVFLGDDAKTYYYPDLRKAALAVGLNPTRAGAYFLYNNYHPVLLGIILERATGKPVTEYFEEKIWRPLGMEYSGSWSLDSEKTGFAKMESGINARAIDFAKFGRLILNNGDWNGQQIVSASWIEEATDMNIEKKPSLHKKSFYTNDRINYNYLWWGYAEEGFTKDEYLKTEVLQEKSSKDGSSEICFEPFAMGKYGQYIYISPDSNMIIIRNGKKSGRVDMWPEIFHRMVEIIE